MFCVVEESLRWVFRSSPACVHAGLNEIVRRGYLKLIERAGPG
jgi:hypothetical protein